MAATSIRRMVATLAVVMVCIFALWELAEWSGLKPGNPEDLVVFYILRGASTAVIMSFLTAWLLIRYRSGYEEQLRLQSEESRRVRVFFENIVRDAGEGILCLDNDDRICSWNRSAEEIYGYGPEEIIGRNVTCLIPKDLIESGEPGRIRELVRSHGFVRNLETRRVRKDGAIISVRITRSVFRDEAGAIIGSSAMISDVSAEKELESRLIQTEKLAAIGETAATIAHEVRNALAGISGTVAVLKGSPLWGELPEGVGAEVDLQVSRIAHIVDDLLAYARPGRLLPQPADLHAILDRAVAALASSPDAKGKKVQRAFAPGESAVEADPTRLEQAFQNVIINAYQSMPPGGTLRIVTRRAGPSLEIGFSDDGPGMPADLRDRAFEPFFTTKARGTGLGLPIVRSIIEAHHGTVQLTSAPGIGTTVTLTLPVPETARGKEMASCKPMATAG
ncbi:MAG: PAS domain S-box protein [Acidobacteria bacterium]|nr:PAS domain S-box protein [Acidobacteriota bacterium]